MRKSLWEVTTGEKLGQRVLPITAMETPLSSTHSSNQSQRSQIQLNTNGMSTNHIPTALPIKTKDYIIEEPRSVEIQNNKDFITI
jgi:hypothetical protein